MVDWSKLMSRCWPSPVRKRWTSAALIAPNATYAVARSATEPPTRVGGLPGIPVIAINPLMPWAMML